MRLLAPLALATVLLLAGKAKGGWPVGLLLGAGGGAIAFMLGRTLRGRAMRNAPPAPPLRGGEQARLHGPVEVKVAGETRRCWAYLSDQRLSLLPLDGGAGVEMELAGLDEVRPAQEGFFGGGSLTVTAKGLAYTLKVPQARRWEAAMRSR